MRGEVSERAADILLPLSDRGGEDGGGAALLDEEGAHQEIDLTEKQLHDCIDRLRRTAGVED